MSTLPPPVTGGVVKSVANAVTAATARLGGLKKRTPTLPSERKLGTKKHPLRVCVLSSSYEGTNSATSEFDSYACGPQNWVQKDSHRYVFDTKDITKADSFRQIRELVTSNKYDIFFNLCDGGRDEKRAGVDVLHALEAHNAAYTGTDSHSFEPNKIDMKILVGSAGVKTPNFVLLTDMNGLAKKCRHLHFPVFVKHVSGYASVGIHKDNRCENMEELSKKLETFLPEFNHALVEEFIRGREGTVLACADPQSPNGVKVFRPMMFKFLKNDDDFAHFENKWTGTWESLTFEFMNAEDPSYAQVVDMARNSFKHVLNGVGYGRCDFRIDPKGDAYFLEINPNCGMWYPEAGTGGDFADNMVKEDAEWSHETFIEKSCRIALEQQKERAPWFVISHDSKGHFTTRASRTVPAGKPLFGDIVHQVPVVAKALFKLGEVEPEVGCVVCRGDGIQQVVAIRHSCEPNMTFVHGQTLTCAARRQINAGEELTLDYSTLRDMTMPKFACRCGTSNCRSVIIPHPPMPRNVDVKMLRKLLQERKRNHKKEQKAARLAAKNGLAAAVVEGERKQSVAAVAAEVKAPVAAVESDAKVPTQATVVPPAEKVQP